MWVFLNILKYIGLLEGSDGQSLNFVKFWKILQKRKGSPICDYYWYPGRIFIPSDNRGWTYKYSKEGSDKFVKARLRASCLRFLGTLKLVSWMTPMLETHWAGLWEPWIQPSITHLWFRFLWGIVNKHTLCSRKYPQGKKCLLRRSVLATLFQGPVSHPLKTDI